MNCPISEAPSFHLALVFHLTLSCLELPGPELGSACLHSLVQSTREKWEHRKSALALRAGAPERMGVTGSSTGSSSLSKPRPARGDDSLRSLCSLPVIKEGVNPCSFGHKVDV